MFINIKKLIKSFLMIEMKAERFLSHILIPLWVLTFYFLSFSRFLPAGINKVFMTRSGGYIVLITGVLCLIFFFILVLKKEKISFFEKSKGKVSYDILILMLLPLILSKREQSHLTPK